MATPEWTRQPSLYPHRYPTVLTTHLMVMNRSCIALLMVLMLSGPTVAEESAEVMLMGTFHFSGPGRDAVKMEKIDITTDESQRYLEDLAAKIASVFEPPQR